MRPEDRRANLAWSAGGGASASDLPIDADLAAIDAELGAAGRQSRGSLHGRTQPTRVFSGRLRDRLLAGMTTPVAAPLGGAALPHESQRGSQLRPELAGGGETWAPAPLQPRLARRTPTMLPRARWALLAAAALTTVLVAGALGARFEWLVPAPTSDASRPPSSPGPETSRPSPDASAAVLPIDTAAPSAGPTEPPTEPPAATRSAKPDPTPTRKPEPTPKPEPTAPPIGSIEFSAKACPGGVFLDWTKPSSSVTHYRMLRSLGGEVPPTYPADGTVEVESATSWSAGVTDGYDAGVGGGQTATYRAFAFGAEDQLLAYSATRTVATVSALSLGMLGAEALGPGSIAVSWGAAEVSAACFTYGKLVASVEDQDPSYVKGSPYLAAIGDSGATGVTLEGLPSGKTVWMRYELIRATGTGSFVVGRTEVLQVTFP